MGIFNGLFRNRSEDDYINIISWNKLEGISDIDGIIEQSELNSIIIFKHSTRCGISGIVLRKFIKKMSTSVTDQKLFYFLNVIKHRDASNEIVRRFNVQHESPQLLVIKQGKVIANDSHYEILNLDLSKYEQT